VRNDILLESKLEHQDVVKKLESKSSEVEILNKRLSKTEKELLFKKEELKDLTKKFKLLEGQRVLLETKEEQIINLVKKLGDIQKRLTAALDKIDEQGQDLEKSMVKRSELDQRVEEAEAIAQKAESFSEKLIFLEQQNEHLRQSKKDFENVILKQQGWFKSRDAKLQNLEKQLQERDDMLVEASLKIDEQRQELESNRAKLSGIDERRAKAEATAKELLGKPLLTLDWNVISAQYPGSKRTKPRCTSLKDRRKISYKSSSSSIGLTEADTVSGMSELEVKSRPANSDLEESESEPSQIFGDADFSPELKSSETYPLAKKVYSPITFESSSVFNFGGTILSSSDHQSTNNKFSLAEGPGNERKGNYSDSSLNEQSLSKIRSYFTPLHFSQEESFSQSKVTCIKMLSSDASLSGSFISSMFDPLNSQKSRKNVELKSQSTNCVETHKDHEFSRESDKTTERLCQLNARIATLEEELRGKDILLKKQSQQLKQYSTSERTIKMPTPSTDTDFGSIEITSKQEERVDNRVHKLEEELYQRNAQIVSEREKISILESKYKKRSQVIVKLINKVGQLQKRLVVRDDSEENLLRAVGIMENGLNNLFDCFKLCCMDLQNMVEELQKRTVDLKYYVAESSSEVFFRQYSLKSIPIKNCITAVSKNFLKHQEEMCSFNQNFKNAVAVIRRLCNRAASSGRISSSSESKSSKVLSSSFHYHLQQSSLSSTDSTVRKRPSNTFVRQKKQPYSKKKSIVKHEPEDFSYKKTVANREASDSATSSIYDVLTSGSERATKVMKRYKLKKKFRRHSGGFKDRSSHPEKLLGEGQVDLTTKTLGVVKKINDKDARIFMAKNSSKKDRDTKRNRKQVTPCVARPPRRRHKAKTLKQLKQSRSNTSRNALLEGLGYSTSPSR